MINVDCNGNGWHTEDGETMADYRVVHVYPCNDTIEHDLDAACDCNPIPTAQHFEDGDAAVPDEAPGAGTFTPAMP